MPSACRCVSTTATRTDQRASRRSESQSKTPPVRERSVAQVGPDCSVAAHRVPERRAVTGCVEPLDRPETPFERHTTARRTRRRAFDQRADRLAGRRFALRRHDWRFLRSSRKNAVDLGVRHDVAKPSKRPSGDLPRGPHERAPGDARERAADADAPHAERGEVRRREPRRRRHEHVDGLRRHRLDHGGDILARPDAGRVEAVGAGVGVGAQPVDRDADVGARRRGSTSARPVSTTSAPVSSIAFRAAAYARGRGVDVVERVRVVPRSILDRQPGDARVHAAPTFSATPSRSSA